MWYTVARYILRYRVLLLAIIVLITAFFTWQARKLELSYEFSKAIPVSSPVYQEYLQFTQRFGQDGSVLVVGVQDEHFFSPAHFSAYSQMLNQIKKIKSVEGIIGVPDAVWLQKNAETDALVAQKIFTDDSLSATFLQQAQQRFLQLPFYRGLIFNPQTSAYLAGITINKQVLASKARTQVVAQIEQQVKLYQQQTGIQTHLSGLPFIRTRLADRIRSEMNFFLVGSLVLALATLVLFFRSASATAISLLVVIVGVVWSLGTMHLFGFKITLLNALIPPLIIVIGIPNCIYFLNKYHMSWEALTQKAAAQTRPDTPETLKRQALINMVGKMGVVTLFCNIAAAVGFAVFALTDSALLKEFGIVAGLNIMMLFFTSLIIIPALLSYLPPPKEQHTRYLRNRLLEGILVKIENWVLAHKKLVYGITVMALLIALLGIFRLKTVGFIVDDLPTKDAISADLKWFEKNFGGVMPLEIEVDTKRKNGITRNLETFEKIDAFASYLQEFSENGKPLTLVEGLKFAKQAYYDNDSMSYMTPNEFDMVFLMPYLRSRNGTDNGSQLSKLTKSFIDSSKQRTRISVNMADVGTVKLAQLLAQYKAKADTLFNLISLEPVNPAQPDGPQKAQFDSSYQIKFTGSSVTYLEGSRFIISGLKESILWAFGLIALTMLLLFKDWRIMVCSLIPNLIPLVITAGVMGWVGVAIKPSTVLVFSVALGIAIDVTIRFLINYKQELPNHQNQIVPTITATIRQTGISIIYTSLVLVAGFIIFMLSKFGGTFSLGWLTSLTLLTATFTNLIFLPVLMIDFLKQNKSGRASK